MFKIMLPILFLLSTMNLAFSISFDFLPLSSRHEPTISPSFFNFYPPPIWQKHHQWYFDDADFFIFIGGILYGLHRQQFEDSPLFREIMDYNRDYLVGRIPRHPIPFDTLKPNVFTNFLRFLYYPNTFIDTNGRELCHHDWMDVKHLCIDWYFPNKTAEILRMLYRRRITKFPPIQQMLLRTITAFEVMRVQQQQRRKVMEIVIEDNEYDGESSDISSVEDNET